VGWSGSGKTTLIESLLLHLPEGRVGYLKSDVHGLRFDPEGTDTDRIFQGGAAQVAIASPVLSPNVCSASMAFAR
jgi:molybdopterin-guanine dinucleotide biosynthesis protein MobB